jgi:hypothetical protein
LVAKNGPFVSCSKNDHLLNAAWWQLSGRKPTSLHALNRSVSNLK